MIEIKKMKPAQLIALSFLITIGVGACLLMMPISTTNSHGLSLVDAIFTATSATCVTGLAVANMAFDLTFFGQLVILVMIQIGGVGLMTLATIIAIFLGMRLGFSHRVALKEALNHDAYDGVFHLTRAVIRYTLTIECLGMILLAFKFVPSYGWGQGIWNSVFHAVSAFNNAGFDLFGNSLLGFQSDWYTMTVIMVLIITGGLGFAVMSEMVIQKRKPKEPFRFRRFSLHTKVVLVMTALLIVVGAVTLFLVEYSNPLTLGKLSFTDKVLNALFQSVTCRTAGFNSLPLDSMTDASLLVMMFLMFIGASPGSTGGGIKTTSIGIILMAVYAIVRGRDDLIVFGRRISITAILKALAVIIISAVLVIVWLIMLTLTEQQGLLSLSFEVISAFSTTGLSMGITGSLSVSGKLLLACLMFVGRIGPLTLAVALTKRSGESKIKYPEGRIMIG